MRLTLRSEALPLLLLAATWALVLYYWPHLPAEIPAHWGPTGEPDRMVPRAQGALIGPVIASVTYAFLTCLPWIDPRSSHWQSFMRIYPVLKSALMAFFALLTFLTLSAATRPGQALTLSWLLVGIGLLFVVLGNYMPTLRSNFFVGIRTPWTLSSEEVWYRTHRAAGRLMVVLGLVSIVSAFLPTFWRLLTFVGGTLLFAVWSVAYSYWAYRKLNA